MAQPDHWNNRLKAVALGLGLALTMLTVRHWYETFLFGHPLCDDCGTDFPSLYTGAKLIWENPTALYDLDQQLVIEKTIDPRLGNSSLAFAYPPFTAFILMPLGWLSFAKAYLVMTVVNGLMLMLALKLLNNSLHLSAEQSNWLTLSTFCNFGVHSTFLQGQTSLIILLLVVLLVHSSRHSVQVSTGLWSGALFFKPQFLPVPMLILAVRRNWRGLSLCFSVVVALAIFAGMLVGQEGIADYIQIAGRFTARQSDLGTNPQDMHNLRALALFAFPSLTALYFWFFLCALVLVGTILLNLEICQKDRVATVQWIGNLLAVLLLSPHLHAHDLALLVAINALILKNCGNSIPVVVPLSLIPLGLWALFPLMFRNQLPPLLPVIFMAGFFWCVWFVRRPSTPS